MKFFHSIRWRLQLWHALLLLFVLAGFGFTAWRLQQTNELRHLDQELTHRVSVLASVMRLQNAAPGRPPGPYGPPPGRPPFNSVEPPPTGRPGPNESFPRPDRLEREGGEFVPSAPAELRLSGGEAGLFESETNSPFYYVVWLRDGRELSRFASAPTAVSRPEPAGAPFTSRFRGTLRECFHYTPRGECILVGRDIRSELADLRRFAGWLMGTGGVVLVLGLVGGWWISTRAIRPIKAISATAARISTGDLTQRIHTADAHSELGELARVLNDTFGRLQASFTRQAQFTADASHELRTPVSVVLTQTQTALARERPAAEYRESLAACQRAAQRMRRLTESLLTLARLDSGEAASSREPCDLERIARDAIELLRPLAQEQGIALEVEATPARCEGNAEQLGQVVTNLVSNAIAYNRPGGSVRVAVTSEADAAALCVNDTGPGIGPEDLPHIFERFYRADKARSNAAGRTGLGLAITQAIVEAHGGTIEVATEAGKGSTFTVRLISNPDDRGVTTR